MRVPVFSDIGQYGPYPPPEVLRMQSLFPPDFQIVYPPEHPTSPLKPPIGLNLHVRVESRPDDPRVGGQTYSRKIPESGLLPLLGTAAAGVDKLTRYVSLTPLDYVLYHTHDPKRPFVNLRNKAILWRFPVEYSKTPSKDQKPIVIYLEPGGGVQPSTLPGVPTPKRTPDRDKKEESTPAEALILVAGLLAGALAYVFYSRSQ